MAISLIFFLFIIIIINTNLLVLYSGAYTMILYMIHVQYVQYLQYSEFRNLVYFQKK